jgi:hypothetical protein
MNWVSEYAGYLLLLVGALAALWNRKRRFDRTNRYGVQEFSSYWAGLRARVNDGLLLVLALGLSGAGVLMLAFQHQDGWGWIVIMAALLWVLFLLIGT